MKITHILIKQKWQFERDGYEISLYEDNDAFNPDTFEFCLERNFGVIYKVESNHDRAYDSHFKCSDGWEFSDWEVQEKLNINNPAHKKFFDEHEVYA